MIKQISQTSVAAAVSVLVGMPAAWAQAPGTGAQVAMYGTIDVAVGQLESQAPGAPNVPITRLRSVLNGGVQTSYFGLRGSEDLGGGLRARFQIESFIRVDTGEATRFSAPVADAFWSRASWVGMDGAFGEVRLGNNANPAWVLNVASSAMSSNALFSPSFRQQYNGSTRGNMALDTALPNSVWYATPRLGGVVGTLAVQAGEGRGTGANIVGSVVYREGALLLGYAGGTVEHQPQHQVTVPRDQTFHVLGATYDLKVVKLFAQYTLLDDKLGLRKVKTPHLGVTVPVGAGEFQLASARAEQTGTGPFTRTTTSGAYLHGLSKRTQLYAIVSADKVPVGTAQSYVTGIRHTF